MNKELIENLYHKILTRGLGLDVESDPNLCGTPERIARMYCDELFCNIGIEFDGFSLFPNDVGYDQIIISDKIHFTSTCSHHFLPFTGQAYVCYIPDEYVVGASKMARLVEHYAKRPQLQETLCHDVINRFEDVLCPRGCMVIMKALHSCMSCRGVKQASSSLITSAVRGAFVQQEVKNEALMLCLSDWR